MKRKEKKKRIEAIIVDKYGSSQAYRKRSFPYVFQRRRRKRTTKNKKNKNKNKKRDDDDDGDDDGKEEKEKKQSFGERRVLKNHSLLELLVDGSHVLRVVDAEMVVTDARKV